MAIFILLAAGFNFCWQANRNIDGKFFEFIKNGDDLLLSFDGRDRKIIFLQSCHINSRKTTYFCILFTPFVNNMKIVVTVVVA